MYLGLLVLSFKFIRQNILDFKEGKTNYSIKLEYITVADLPTICFCLSSKYNIDENFAAFIYVYSPNEYNVVSRPLQLMRNRSAATFFGLEFLLSAFEQREASGQCYKISPKWMGSLTIDFTQLQIDLILEPTSNLSQGIHKSGVNIFVTSEKNSYGLAKREWFDGNLDPNFMAWNEQVIRIVNVNDYIHLEEKCIDDSYYECLAKRMKTFDMSKISIDTHFNKSICANHSVCAPGVSLPTIEGYEILSCPTLVTDGYNYNILCSNAVMTQLINDQSEHCEKCCYITDFQLEIDSTDKLLESDKYWCSPNVWIVRFEFHTPMTRFDSRLKRPFKTIHEEYLVHSEISLIGTIGGTMGMLVGFSIMGTSEWVMLMVIPKVLYLTKCILKKCRLENQMPKRIRNAQI